MFDSPIFILVAVVVWLWLYRALYNLSVSQVSLQCKCVSQFPLSNSGLVVTSYPPFDRLKEQKNLNSFFAVMFGLGNSAVHRLHKTWEVREASAQQQTANMNCVDSRLTLHAAIVCRESPARQRESTVPTRGWWWGINVPGSIPGRILPYLHVMLTTSTCNPLQDPSRNHRAYRLAVAKLSPPYIPFMPLLLKGERLQPVKPPWDTLVMC